MQGDDKRDSLLMMNKSHWKDENNGTFETYLLLLKSFIGIGIMFIPSYFGKIGWIYASSTLFLVSILVLTGLYNLIECRKEFKVSYPRIAEIASGIFMKIPYDYAIHTRRSIRASP